MHSKVYIVNTSFSNAAIYAYDFVFHNFFGVDVKIIADKSSIPEGSIVISHGVLDVENALFVPRSPFINELSFEPTLQVETGVWSELPILFPGKGEIPFDIFTATFYLLARVEEYGTNKRDTHGRFEWKNSILSQPEFHRKPIVDLWLKKFGDYLKNRFPQFELKARKFEWINTFDIDIAFAYSHRSPLRALAATGKNLVNGNFSKVGERGKVLLKKIADPFDTYSFQEEISKKSHCRTLYFFLLGSGGQMDRNISPDNKQFQGLIKHINSYAEVGIHPSYLSGDKLSEFAIEKNRLEAIIEEPVTQSRQHFLRMSLPITYRRLIKEGITADYTMGYAEQLGFRSGTCTPHYFFDLKNDSVTTLEVFPLTVMEGTLRDYLKLSPDKAIEEYKNMIASVAEVGGTFISLWHNDSIRASSPWRGVYQYMVDELNSIISQEGK